MEYKNIKNLDKKMSKIIYGTAGIFGCEEEESFKLLDSMYELGVNTFDTAAVYGDNGEAKLIKWIAERGIHDDVVLISKCAHHNAWRTRANPFDIMSDINDALAKPGADYIDIYLMHRDDPSVPVSAIIDTLNRLYESGKIKSFGASNWQYKRVEEANEYAYKFGLMPFSTYSPHYGLAEQVNDPWGGGSVSISGPNNVEAREYYKKINMPILAYSSLANGFLSGKFKACDTKGAEEFLRADTKRGYMYPCNFERLRRAEILSEKMGISVAKLSLAWLLNKDLNTFAIISTKRKESMIENISAFDIKLEQNELDWLDLVNEEL